MRFGRASFSSWSWSLINDLLLDEVVVNERVSSSPLRMYFCHDNLRLDWCSNANGTSRKRLIFNPFHENVLRRKPTLFLCNFSKAERPRSRRAEGGAEHISLNIRIWKSYYAAISRNRVWMKSNFLYNERALKTGKMVTHCCQNSRKFPVHCVAFQRVWHEKNVSFN